MLKPRKGADVLHSHDGGLVTVGKFAGGPVGRVQPVDYGIVIICTAGEAQFEYDGQPVRLWPKSLFLFFARTVMDHFMCSPDFDCREVWFSRAELWDMNMFGGKSISDLVSLKQHPSAPLSEAEYVKLDTYFQLICLNLKNPAPTQNKEIVRSLFSTFILETLAILRNNYSALSASGNAANKYRGKVLANKFVELAKQSDGRIRKVEEFAQMLNVTSKYLSKLLMKTMSRKPSEIISLFTLKAIENRLRFTDMSMQQISDELGFSSASSFGKYVKDHTGMAPLEFRKQYQERS